MQPDNTNFSIKPPDSKAFGLSYPEWTQKWWQWITRIPRLNNPLVDIDGKNCSQMQFGPVWFLAGTLEENPKVIRKCNSPKSTVIIPISNIMTKYDENYSDDEISSNSMHVSIDGIEIQNLEKFRITTGMFMIDSVPDNVFNLPPEKSERKSDGYWLIISFREDEHLIRIKVEKNNFVSDVTYNLLIRERDINKEIIDKLMSEFDNSYKKFALTKRTAYNYDVQQIVKESMKYSEVPKDEIIDFNLVAKNIDESLNYALFLANQDNRNVISDRDMTNAIIDLGLFRKWHTWPFCKSSYSSVGNKNRG